MTQPSLETDSSSPPVLSLVGHETDTRLVLQDQDRLEPCETNEYDDSCSDSSGLSDDDGRNHREIALPSGAIQATVQNSTGTTIAHNLTHITGPVTIHNYPPSHQNGEANGTLGITHRETSVVGDVPSGSDVKKNDPTSTNHQTSTFAKLSQSNFFQSHKTVITLTSAVLILIILTISLTLSLVLRQHDLDNHSTTSTEYPYTTTTENPIQVISKTDWGGRDPLNVTVVESGSVPLVVVKHTGGKYCSEFKECASILQELQSYHVGTYHSPDIWYNFLIGGDGNIYVGRDWNVQNQGRRDTVDICFMGDFDTDIPTDKMIEAGKQVVINGIVAGYIFMNYNVVNHNQTENTTSPGANLYREVKKWPNYYGNVIPSNCQIHAQNDLEACHHSNTYSTTIAIHKKLFSHFGSTSRITAAVLAFILAFTIAVAIYYTLFQENHFPIPSSAPTQNVDLGEGIFLVPRAGWNARPPLGTVPFTQKPALVIVKHTGGGKCFDFKTCTSKMVALQSLYVGEKKMKDIDYHFVIGGDGNVYEGRGWDVQDETRLDSISICYPGNFVDGYDKLTAKMVRAGVRLLEKGLELGKLRKDYKVVAHNQTYNTQSPGDNVYKEVKKWPHYYGGLMFN